MNGSMRRSTHTRELNRKYDAENWSGKAVLAHDAARVEIAVQAAIAGSHFGVFQRDLTAGCAEVGWQYDHPMTLWTVALYANVFPVCEMPLEVRRTDGLIHFAEPSVALPMKPRTPLMTFNPGLDLSSRSSLQFRWQAQKQRH